MGDELFKGVLNVYDFLGWLFRTSLLVRQTRALDRQSVARLAYEDNWILGIRRTDEQYGVFGL